MPTYRTQYSTELGSESGPDISAPDLNAACAIAHCIAELEQTIQKPRFRELVVLGEKAPLLNIYMVTIELENGNQHKAICAGQNPTTALLTIAGSCRDSGSALLSLKAERIGSQ